MSEEKQDQGTTSETDATCYASPTFSDGLFGCAQCGSDPAQYCTADRYKGREPHNLDGAWMRCNRCGNTITVIGRNAVRRVRRCWNVSAS